MSPDEREASRNRMKIYDAISQIDDLIDFVKAQPGREIGTAGHDIVEKLQNIMWGLESVGD